MVIGLYWLLSKLDWLIYWVVSMFFRIIMDLADPDKIKFFEDIEVNNIKQKVLVIVGVLMLFKLVFSAIQYLINPDSFDDKEKGMGGVLKRMVITMLLIVLVPVVFEFAFTMQESIVVTIQNIILNTNASEKVDHDRLGQQMSYSVLQSFVRPNNGGTVGGFGDTSAKIHDLDTFRDNAWKGCGLLFDASGCEYDYMIFISTICGGFLCYVLLSLALDVTIRTIKFGIIQILSPIPISSYIFGKEKFNKFMKMAGQVYADLFIRMGIIFAIIAIVQVLIRSGILNPTGMANTGSWIYDMILHVVVIIGLFMFAKNAPKFISELLGIPDIGAGDMADMFKPAWQRAGGAAGALANPIGNAISNWKQTRDIYGGKGHKGEALRRAIAGFGRGALDSAQGVMAGDDWTKMRQRHDAAKQRSLERAKTKKNRADVAQEGESRLSTIFKQMNKLTDRIKLKKDPAVQQEAETRYQEAVAKRDRIGAAIRQGIDSGRLQGEDLTNALKEYNDLNMALADRDGWINNEKNTIAAEREQKAKVQGYQDRITEIDRQIASGTLSDSERMDLEVEKNTLLNNIEGITHDHQISETRASINAARTRTQEIDTILANGGTGDATIDQLNSDEARIRSTYSSEIDAIERRLSNRNLTEEEHAAILKEREDKIAQRDEELATVRGNIDVRLEELRQEKKAKQDAMAAAGKVLVNISNEKQAEINRIASEYATAEIEIGKLDDQKDQIVNEINLVNQGIRESGWRSNVKSYLGASPVSGKGYADLSSLLGQTRSSIYTTEAMTKMRQNADILVDINGNPLEFTTKFGDGKHSYEDMATIKQKLASHEIDERDLQGLGFRNSAVFQSAFEDIEKQAAAAYINANIAMIDDTVASLGYRLKRPELNSAVVEMWNSFEGELVKLGVPGDQIGKLKNDFRKNPGKFMSGASTLKDTYASVSKKIVDTQKPSDSGKK